MKLNELEALAEAICNEQQEKTAKLHRMIRSYSKIINAREPHQFPRKPLVYADEGGHCDNTYPPKQKYQDHSGPRLLKIVGPETEEVATSSGFYYSWRRTTSDPGLYIAPDGGLYGAVETGTGALGQFAAHPGDCNVEVTREYPALDPDDVPHDRLVKAEKELRLLAFPHLARHQKSAVDAAGETQ